MLPPSDNGGADLRPLFSVYDPVGVARINASSRHDPETGCRIWQRTIANNGYGALSYRGKVCNAHRLCYIAHFGPIPPGMYVCHRCDTRACVAIEHLFLGTPQQNVDDMRAKGRARYCSKISAGTAAAIKRRLIDGECPGQIARLFGVSYSIVFSIKSNVTWRSVAPAPPLEPDMKTRVFGIGPDGRVY